MKKVIFIYPKKATFIDLDIEILSKKYDVTVNTYNWTNKFALPINLIKQLFFLIWNIKYTDIIIVSFGGYWSVIPSILGKICKKPIFIILHGTDCASFKELNYGGMRKPLLKYALRVSYKYATKLLPVSESLIYNENTYFKSGRIIKQGYKHFFKKNTTPIEVIHNAIDTDKWHIDNSIKRKDNRFITVLSNGQFKIKGCELITEVANKFPNCEFLFIGIDPPENHDDFSDNITFYRRQTPSELLRHYNESQYYLQLSLTEGFGCALAESMACGCVPIVSKVNILPDIVGNTGYILKERNVNSLELLIKNIKTSGKRESARNRIIELYSIRKRQELLFKTLEKEI